MSLFLNHSVTISHWFRRVSTIFFKSLLLACSVLSSAKFASSASFVNKNKSFKNILKIIGPRIDVEF